MLRLQILADSGWADADLFDNQDFIPFEYEAYDSEEIDKVKNPFNISLNIPLTEANKEIFNNYNPVRTPSSLIPDDKYDFKILSDGNLIVSGNIFVETITYNTDAPFYVVRLEDKVTAFLKKVKEDKMGDYYTDLNTQLEFRLRRSPTDPGVGFFDVYGGNPNSDNFKDVAFPYIDMCGDEDWRGGPWRAYTQYGFSAERTNFVPCFKVKSFIERLFSQNGFSVESKMLGINQTASGEINPERAYFFSEGRLICDDTYPANRITFTLTPYKEFITYARPFSSFYFPTNDDYDNSVNLDGIFWKENVNKGHNIRYNNNVVLNEYDKYVEYRMAHSYAATLGEIGGFVAPNVTYNAKVVAKNFNIPNNSSEYFAIQIPAVFNSTTSRLNPVYDIDLSASTMKFAVRFVIYEDGYPKYDSYVNNSNGERLEISSSNCTKLEGYPMQYSVVNASYGNNYSTTARNGNEDIFEWVDDANDDLTTKNNSLKLPANTSFYIPEIPVSLFANSEYSIAYYVEPLDGDLVLKTYNRTISIMGNYWGMGDEQTITVQENGFDYLFGRYIGAYHDTKFTLTIDSIGDGRSPIKYNDEVNVWFSIEKTVNLNPFDALKYISRRFNLNIVYDYENDTFVLDTLKNIRGNTSQTFDGNIDDLMEIQVSLNRDRNRYLNIKNENYGLEKDTVDGVTYGDLSQYEIVADGEGEKDLSLGSAIYNNGLGGNENVEVISSDARASYNIAEQGYSKREFTSVKDIGVRFGYLDRPTRDTYIYGPKLYVKGYSISNQVAADGFIGSYQQDRDGSHRRFGTYYLGGVLKTVTSDSLDLDFSNPSGYVTEFLNDDRVLSLYKPTVSFNVVLNSDYISNPYQNFSPITISLMNSNTLYIKSLKGDIVNDRIYGTVDAIIL